MSVMIRLCSTTTSSTGSSQPLVSATTPKVALCCSCS
ncbi:hypothetical protein RO3G_04792 [Rhizopus delemar RA 99-880]|uniref:Uncharacterized protein n=1 Tax=Rhizopus delemar (strain RA 99-880 / ATCC MYA-4621 / FGSC 9543 / NRRL 43880) TaxID=246409 RepID=I1BV57_RHIO9|nr:hypothetical protein RO3G_04792 [Rhizopus delemar RA 99-880]|eukprot:EIE80087.1 hypothetical protein RO3G_04792 [Rhizopus delemar RA 99-880]